MKSNERAPSIKSFFGEFRTVYKIKDDGSYSNSFWLLKPEAMSQNLKRFLDKKYIKKGKEIKSAEFLWGNAAQNVNSLELLGDDYKDKYSYVLSTKEGNKVDVDKKYYDYLKRWIIRFNLKGDGSKAGVLTIYSGNVRVGLLTPRTVSKFPSCAETHYTVTEV